ncbi:MAG TPA: pyridoxal phosphate-dependent aminotransferase, partial [Polyangiaceae bacterium]
FLSVGTPVQHALPALLTSGKITANAIRTRTRSNLATVDRAIDHASTITRLRVDGGWYATLRLPRTRSEEEWVLALLDEGVLVHPGAFFDFESEAYVVVSLLTPEAVLAEGIAKIVALVANG